MTHCKACIPTALRYEIRFSGEDHVKHLPKICLYLESHELLIEQTSDSITVTEEAMAGLYDYFSDHMDLDLISFSINRFNWQPIKECLALIDERWIDKVIWNQDVFFHIQPIVNGKGEVFAYEMLARFEDEKGKLISPFHAFSAAKSRNRTYALDRVCRMSAVENAAKIDKKVFINFLPTSIYSPEHCLRTTVQLAEQLGIAPSRFVFEVVETEQVDDLAHLKKILTYYREKGFSYALDDVGEGFSTIEVLKELAPHFMKLDMKFVQGVSQDEVKQKAAGKFLAAAIQVGAVPLAEGVEEQADFDWLKTKGYQLFQGYLFGKPAPIPSTVQ